MHRMTGRITKSAEIRRHQDRKRRRQTETAEKRQNGEENEKDREI